MANRRETLARRQWMASVYRSALGISACGWLPGLASAAIAPPKRRHCIVLWMSGGPSQTDTFDMKPGHENGGEFKEIGTNVPGIRISEHLPGLAQHADQLSIIRSLRTKEGDHGRGTHLMRTGQKPMGPIQYPAIGASLGKELSLAGDVLPNYISIAPYRVLSQDAFGPGFLGPGFGPLVIAANDVAPGINQPTDADGFAQLRVESLQAPAGTTAAQQQARLSVWNQLQSRFLAEHAGGSANAHDTVYRSALSLMNSDAAKAFDLAQEPTALREAYGKGQFGQSCLLARRLIEHGVGFVEVTLNGWDTHSDNFEQVRTLSNALDAGWSTLLQDLKQRGLLESTTILWMGEFGRTPGINTQTGRDHFPSAWSCVFAGGGIRGGSVFGKTSADGMAVEEQPVDAPRVLATLCAAVGLDPATENMSNTGRPIPVIDATPISEILS